MRLIIFLQTHSPIDVDLCLLSKLFYGLKPVKPIPRNLLVSRSVISRQHRREFGKKLCLWTLICVFDQTFFFAELICIDVKHYPKQACVLFISVLNIALLFFAEICTAFPFLWEAIQSTWLTKYHIYSLDIKWNSIELTKINDKQP